MERTDRLGLKYKYEDILARKVRTYMTFDAGHEEFINISLRVLDEVRRGLFGRNGNQRNSLVRRLEPDNFGTFHRSSSRFVTTITFTFTPLGLLLLFGGSG